MGTVKRNETNSRMSAKPRCADTLHSLHAASITVTHSALHTHVIRRSCTGTVLGRPLNDSPMSHSSTAREINDESLRGRDETPAINDFGLVDVLAGPRSGPLGALSLTFLKKTLVLTSRLTSFTWIGVEVYAACGWLGSVTNLSP